VRNSSGWKERSAWITVVAVLATALLWLALLSGFALAGTHVVPPVAAVLMRTAAKVVLALVVRGWPVLPLLLLGGMMLAVAARGIASLARKVRHA
jgi:hypothetical protein